MVVYLFVALSPILLSLAFPSYCTDKKQKRCFYVALVFIFLLFVGCRSIYLGSEDTQQYVYSFSKARLSTSLTDYLASRTATETGFNVFEWFLTHILRFDQAIILVTSFLYIASVCVFADRNSKNPALTITLYITIELFLFNIQGMRQSIAMSLCLLSYEFIKNRKLVPFLLLCFLALTFHRTAVVFFPMYFLYGLKVTRIRVLALLPIFILVLLFSKYIVSVANDVFSSGGIDRQYSDSTGNGGFFTLVIHLVIIVFSLFSMQKFGDKNNCLLFYTSLLSLLCFTMRYFGVREAERISFYFSYAQLALLPNSLASFDRKSRIGVGILVVCLATFIFISKLTNNNFLPYRFFWSD